MGEGQGVSPSTPLPHARALASQALTRSAVRFSHFISRLESFIRLSGRGEARTGRGEEHWKGTCGQRRGQLVSHLVGSHTMQWLCRATCFCVVRCSSIYAVAVVWCVLWKFYEAVVVFSLCGCEGGWSGGGMGALCPG